MSGRAGRAAWYGEGTAHLHPCEAESQAVWGDAVGGGKSSQQKRCATCVVTQVPGSREAEQLQLSCGLRAGPESVLAAGAGEWGRVRESVTPASVQRASVAQFSVTKPYVRAYIVDSFVVNTHLLHIFILIGGVVRGL